MAREGMKVNWLSLAAVGVILLPLFFVSKKCHKNQKSAEKFCYSTKVDYLCSVRKDKSEKRIIRDVIRAIVKELTRVQPA